MVALRAPTVCCLGRLGPGEESGHPQPRRGLLGPACPLWGGRVSTEHPRSPAEVVWGWSCSSRWVRVSVRGSQPGWGWGFQGPTRCQLPASASVEEAMKHTVGLQPVGSPTWRQSLGPCHRERPPQEAQVGAVRGCGWQVPPVPGERAGQVLVGPEKEPPLRVSKGQAPGPSPCSRPCLTSLAGVVLLSGPWFPHLSCRDHDTHERFPGIPASPQACSLGQEGDV